MHEEVYDMGIFRKKNKIQYTNIYAESTRAIHQDRDFPLIDVKFKARDKETNQVDEVTITMTLWEANQFCEQMLLIVSNTTRLVLPRQAINVPWGEGGPGL